MDQAKPAGPACGAPTAHFPFAIRDEQGEVAVAGFTLPDRQSFRIELARPLAGKATVTDAPGPAHPCRPAGHPRLPGHARIHARD